DILPPAFQTVIKLNPLLWLIDNYHRVMVYDARPDLVVLSLLGLLALVFLALGMTLFRKASAEMVDVL
ncbi:MAG TPA: ABC transporter, partial [Agrobacterium sp.]|nr:ABC transporter [Agrobacterium sp.]